MSSSRRILAQFAGLNTNQIMSIILAYICSEASRDFDKANRLLEMIENVKKAG